MPKVTIQAIGVETDGVQVGYYLPDEGIKANGVLHMHTLIVPVGADYDDEIEAILQAARHLVLDVIEDLPRLDRATVPEQP